MRPLSMVKALNEAIYQCMLEDKNIIVLGENVCNRYREETYDLDKYFSKNRVIDMPISEAAFTGFANGAAMAGLRPIVEFQVAGLIYPAFDQIVNQAAKLRLMLGGQCKIPVTFFIMGAGAGGGRAGQHSDNPYPLLIHCGIKTVIPSSPEDAKGLMISSILENDPVAIIIPAGLIEMTGEVPEGFYKIPFANGKICREGHDVTVCAIGNMVPIALKLADKLMDEGIQVEIFDPRSLLPFDKDSLLKSIQKTRRLVIADDSNRSCGFAAEISAVVAENFFNTLKAPIKRITRADMTIPYSAPIEKELLPDLDKLESAVRFVIS